MTDDELKDLLAEGEAKARKEIADGTDEGHNNLIKDLTELLDEAKGLQFHDMLNDEYAAPKVVLRNKLSMLMSNVVESKYDN